jgi:hypothetical protein
MATEATRISCHIYVAAQIGEQFQEGGGGGWGVGATAAYSVDKGDYRMVMGISDEHWNHHWGPDTSTNLSGTMSADFEWVGSDVKVTHRWANDDPAGSTWEYIGWWRPGQFRLGNPMPVSVSWGVGSSYSGLGYPYIDYTEIVIDGETIVYPWDSDEELLDWQQGDTDAAIVEGGTVHAPHVPGGYAGYYWVRRNWVPRRLGSVRALAGLPVWEEFCTTNVVEHLTAGATGSETILTGSYTDPSPWVTPNGNRYVALVNSGGELQYITYDGTWGAPVTIRSGRRRPSALCLLPSNDVFVACIDSSKNLLIDILRWNGTGYTVEATEKSVGVTASETGGMWLLPTGQIGLAYVTPEGTLAMVTGDLTGDTWTA